MDKYSKAIILGALIDAFENLEQDKTVKTLFQSKGEAAFMGFS
jgi:Conjugal transfer protein TraD